MQKRREPVSEHAGVDQNHRLPNTTGLVRQGDSIELRSLRVQHRSYLP